MKEKILEILSEIRPECDFSEDVDFIKNGLLDSMEVVILVDELQEEFDVAIPGTEISMTNFSSLDAIANLVKKYKE
jgi:acyl carrier protein